MTQPTPNPRTQRSVAGMIYAMAITVVVGGGWYFINRPSNADNPVQTVEWKPWVTSGRDDHKLVTLAPVALPAGWRATSAQYQSGVSPHWELGMLTRSQRFVGLEESYDYTDAMVHRYVDKNAVKGKDVTLGGVVWQTWTDAGGDYGLIRTLPAPSGQQERVLVYGSAPGAQIRAFAGSLTGPG
jgi:hypothetical protein